MGYLYADFASVSTPPPDVLAVRVTRVRDLLPTDSPVGADGEYLVDQAILLEAIGLLRGVRWQVAPGGATIAAAQRVARCRPDRRVGVVGMAGTDLIPEAEIWACLADAKLDGRHVAVSPQLSGMRLTVGAGPDRLRLACPGANDGFGAYLRGQESDLAEYLAGAWVHLTLPSNPEPVLDLAVLLAAVRRIHHRTRVSLDITEMPAAGGHAVLSDLAAVADVLLIRKAQSQRPEPDTVNSTVDALARLATGNEQMTCVAIDPDGVSVLSPATAPTRFRAPDGVDLRAAGVASSLVAAAINAGVDGVHRIGAGIHDALTTSAAVPKPAAAAATDKEAYIAPAGLSSVDEGVPGGAATVQVRS